MEIKLIIYDLDGTLVDSAPDIAAAVNRMRHELGHAEKPLDQIKQWVGNGSAMLVKRSLGEELQLKPEEVPQDIFQSAHDLFFKHYRITNGQYTAVFPSVRDTLEYFKQKQMQQAVCTNKPGEFTNALLRKLALDDYFRVVASGDTLAVKKPDPAPLFHCAEQGKVDVQDCLMVGDSMTDVKAAKNAGMKVVCVGYGYNRGDNLAQECQVIRDFALLPRIVAGLPH